MKTNELPIGTPTEKPEINVRQLCFFVAFVLPVAKLLTLPARLAEYAENDLLLPALAHFLLQAGVFAVFLFVASRSDKSLFELVEQALGKVAARVVYFLYAAFFVFLSLLPLVETERFVYTAFFDTAPVSFSLTPFFLLSAFIACKDLKAFGRSADASMPLFLTAFIGLVGMALPETSFSAVLPVGGMGIKASANAFRRTFADFSDVALMLPMLGAYRYEKGDAKKALGAYAAGASFVLFFLAVFYGIYGPVALRQKYAFVKIAQYFSALDVVGRLDLLLTYLMTVVLLFYLCLPLQLSVLCVARAVGTEKRVWISLALNLALFLYTLFCTVHYNRLYALLTGTFTWVFPVFSTALPLLTPLLLLGQKRKGQGRGERKIFKRRKADA